MYALDTNTVIYFFKRQGKVAGRLLATPPAEIGLPAVVLYELEVGVAKSPQATRRRAQLAELVRFARVLPFDRHEARVTASLRARLEQLGRGIGPLDSLIAGTALSHGATLVTHNVYEFQRVPGLQLEDWYE
jgi:tRNA(fMet)-specific endonuclease VapC